MWGEKNQVPLTLPWQILCEIIIVICPEQNAGTHNPEGNLFCMCLNSLISSTEHSKVHNRPPDCHGREEMRSWNEGRISFHSSCLVRVHLEEQENVSFSFMYANEDHKMTEIKQRILSQMLELKEKQFCNRLEGRWYKILFKRWQETGWGRCEGGKQFAIQIWRSTKHVENIEKIFISLKLILLSIHAGEEINSYVATYKGVCIYKEIVHIS